MRSFPLFSSLTAGGLLAVLLATALPAAPRAPRPSSSGAAAELFEREVRPLLVSECGSCHGEAVQQGGLRLDSRAAALRGGGRGASLVPGDPGRSRLLAAVRHQGGLQMPPGKRLPEVRAAALEAWIRAGAPWPESPPSATSGAAGAAARPLWALRPLRLPPPPVVRRRDWARGPLDLFVLARLEQAGLSPSPEADPRTLLRRVTYDLTGLPPTPEEVEAFLREYRGPGREAAYGRVVDRLLASPAYGERWGRHWLDVARYADTKDGVLMYGDGRIRPYAYTYRDYVIRALSEDTPYDRFVHEQLAADLIAPKVEPWRLAAMGFLTLGRQFDNNIHDIIDDRIDTVTRGLMGLTVACARCHDHKYDPVPTADYYSLYGVFASSEAPLELPLIQESDGSPAVQAFEKEYLPKRKELLEHVDKQFALLSETARERAGDYLVHAATTPPDPLETAIFFLSLAPEDLRPQVVARWRRLLESRARPDDPVFGPWRELMESSAAAGGCEAVMARWRRRPAGTRPGELNPLVAEALSAAKLTDRVSVARMYGDLLKRVYAETRPASAPPTPAQAQLLELVTGPSSPGYFRKSETYYYLSRAEKDRFGGLRNELDVIAVRHAAAPARAMVLFDSAETYEPKIFVRGNPAQPGAAVPRQFLSLVAGPKRRPFARGSGRLELARAITDPANPLTARVLVNRVWMHHFGEPLAATPSDFGRRSTPPTHPELLDYLATGFTRGDYRLGAFAPAPGIPWSLKRLHRLIVTSATYRQASADRPECRQRDPENRLLWRAHRRRLEFEQMRDTLLAVSGRLEATPGAGGRPVKDAVDPGSRRRTVYCLVDRQSLPEVFRTFNFPQPDQSVERRPNTTVPQQALFGLNSPFVLAQARALAERPEVAGAPPGAARIQAMYRLVLARPPDAGELAAGLAFVAGVPSAPAAPAAGVPHPGPWEQYAQVLLLANELLFLD